MLAIILAISLFSSSDTAEMKGMKDIYCRVFVNKKNFYFI